MSGESDYESDMQKQMREAGWICNQAGWWHPPSCTASWPFKEAMRIFLSDQNKVHSPEVLK